MPLDSSGSGTWLAGTGIGETFPLYGDLIELQGAMAARVFLGVERATGLDLESIAARGRTKQRAAVRKAAIWLLVEVGGLTYSAIGRLLGRDHTTIMFAHRHAMEDFAARWVIEAVLNQRGSFDVVPPAHGGSMLL